MQGSFTLIACVAVCVRLSILLGWVREGKSYKLKLIALLLAYILVQGGIMFSTKGCHRNVMKLLLFVSLGSYHEDCICCTVEVWLAEHNGKKVAVKMLKDLRDSKASSQFVTEAAVMT